MVALTIFLMSVVVLNRLDDLFRQQQLADLRARTELVARFVDGVARLTIGTDPVVEGDNSINPVFAATLRSEAMSRFMAEQLADADVDVVVGTLPTAGGDAGAIVPADGGIFHADAVAPAQAGLTQESLSRRPDRLARGVEPVPVRDRRPALGPVHLPRRPTSRTSRR